MSMDPRLATLLSRVRPSLAGIVPYTVPPEPPPVKLDANESPWPLPPEARALVAERLAAIDFHRYPDGRASALRTALAAYLDAREDELVIGVGSDEAIAILLGAFARTDEAGQEPAVLFPGPSFVMYGVTAKTHGLRPVEVPLKPDWSLDEAALHDAFLKEEPALAFWASPNNPTGNVFDPKVLRRLIEAHPRTLHVVDEAYGPFHRDTPEARASTHAAWLAELPQVALLGTLSKIGFAGARLGWARLHPTLAYELEKVRQPFNLNALGQELARLALTELRPTLEAQLQAIVRERAVLEAGLDACGVERFPSQANFILFRTPHDASALRAALLERGVAVRVFAKDPRLAGCVRVTVGTPDENAAFLAALREALDR